MQRGENIDLLKNEIQKGLSQLPHLDEYIPSSFFIIKEKLQDSNNDFIEYDDYQEVCREVDPGLSLNSMKILIGLLNDLGIMINIPEHRRLEETQVLNPEWLTNGVYQIVTSAKLKGNKGHLTYDEISEILRHPRNNGNYQRRKAQYIIIDMMDHFQLCYKLEAPYTETYLLPIALPKDIPDNLTWDFKEKLKFQFSYQTLPNSIISTLIVKLLPLARNNDYWRNGIVISHESNEALIRADHFNKVISIQVGGDGNKRETLGLIRTYLEVIHNGFDSRDINVVGSVIVSEDGLEAKIPLEHLITMEKDGIEKQYFPELRKYLSVKDILEGVRTQKEIDSIYLNQLKDKIARGNVEHVISELRQNPSLPDEFEQELTMLSSSYYRNLKEVQKGVIEYEKTNLDRNRCADALLNIINRLSKRGGSRTV